MIIIILALIDIHTLFVLLFHNHLPAIYVFSGSSFAILKGLTFYLPFRDMFSLIDIIIGTLMLFLLLGELWNFIWWFILLYLIYKIISSFAAI
jgi:hypothetical protein